MLADTDQTSIRSMAAGIAREVGPVLLLGTVGLFVAYRWLVGLNARDAVVATIIPTAAGLIVIGATFFVVRRRALAKRDRQQD